MKKLIFVLLLCLNLSAFSQKHFIEVDPKSYIQMEREDIDYKTFLESANVILKIKNLEVSKDLEVGISPNNKFKVIIGKIEKSSEFNYIFSIINVERKEAIYFVEKYVSTNNQISSILYDEQLEKIYETLQTEGNIKIIEEKSNVVSAKATCFRTCMTNQQENFEDTWYGWGAWNLPPHSVVVQGMAATECQGCCKGWWDNAGCH